MNALALNISNIPVRQDSEGRYNLNDLHKASGGDDKNKPANFLRAKQAVDLIELLRTEQSIGGIAPIQSKQGLGTFSVKELVYAYAMWISPAFTLKVIHAYDSLYQPQYGLKQLPEPPTITKAEIGFLFNRVNAIAGPDSKMRAAIWSRFQKHFAVNSYKELPADRYEEACLYLNAKGEEYRNGAEMLYLSNFELAALIDARVKALEVERLKGPSNSSADTFKAKILTVFTRGDEPSQSIVPYDSCIVSGSDLTNVKTFLREYVPVEFMPEIMGVVSQRLIDNAKIKA